MNLRIEILGSKPQLFQVNKNSLVSEVVDVIIQKNKMKELNQQLSLYLNGIELRKESRILNHIKFANDILQLKKNEQFKQLQGIKLFYNNQIKIAYVYLDDSNIVLYDQAEKQFSLSKDSFKLYFKNQILEKLTQLKQNQIDANSTIEVKIVNQQKQQKQMINLKLKYKQEEKILTFDLYSKIFELEEQAKSLFKINQDICIQNDKKILLQDQKLIDVDLNQNYCLLILLKELYSKSLSYINIVIDYNGQSFQMQVSTDTLISEIIDLLKTQNNLTNIDLMMDSQILPLNQTIIQLNIKENSILNIIPKLNNILVLNLKIGSKMEKIEVDQETIISELIQQIECNFVLQNIELKLWNGQQLHKNQSLKQQNIQSGTQLIIQCFNPNQNRQQPENDLTINIQVSVQPSQQIFSYQFLYNSLIQDLQRSIRTQLNCQNKIQLVYQNRILNQQSTFAQEGVPNGCLLQCNLLIDKIEEKIKFLDKPVIQDPLIKIITLFQNDQKEKLMKGNTLVETLIQGLKSQYSLDQEIYLSCQGKILNPQQTLKENEIKDHSQIIVHFINLQLCIKYKGNMENLEVSLDTLGEELMLQIKQQYKIENDFDILINGTKMNLKQQLKDLNLQNKQCLEIQEKQKQKQIIITEQMNQTNQQNQQLQQQGYQQVIQNNQINQQIPSKQYQQSYETVQQSQQQQQLLSQSQQQQQQQQNQPIKNKTIVIKQVEEIKSNKNNQKKQPIITILSNKFKIEIEFQWETKIQEIIDYITTQYPQLDQIKLIFNGKTLQPNQTLEEIEVNDHDIIQVEQIKTN